MSEYHIKVKKGRTEKPHPCDGYTVTTMPKEGYYAEHPEVINMPPGQKVRLDLEREGKIVETILLPRDGSIAFVLNNKGDTIDSYPKKRDRQFRTVEEKSEGTAVEHPHPGLFTNSPSIIGDMEPARKGEYPLDAIERKKKEEKGESNP